MSRLIARLERLEQRRTPDAVASDEADLLLDRSLCILVAHAPCVSVEDFGSRLADGTATDADREALHQLAQAGQSDPAGFVRWVAALSRSV